MPQSACLAIIGSYLTQRLIGLSRDIVEAVCICPFMSHRVTEMESFSGDLHERLTIWCPEMKVNILRFALGSRAWVNSHLVYRHYRSSPTRLHLHRDGFYFWLLQVDLG